MSRKLARQTAFQILYQLDLAKTDLQETLDSRLAELHLEQADRDYLFEAVKGVVTNRTEVDELLARFAKDWKVERMGYVDRNILRLAAYELYSGDVPDKVIVNEAVELAKRFSDARAAKFINGILGSIIDVIAVNHSDE